MAPVLGFESQGSSMPGGLAFFFAMICVSANGLRQDGATVSSDDSLN
jgi:hypothetical protein